jgi:hypothetical protein
MRPLVWPSGGTRPRALAFTSKFFKCRLPHPKNLSLLAPPELVMSVVCPHRHVSYTRWRLQVFRSLFLPHHLQTILGRGYGVSIDRWKDHRSLTTSVRLAKRKSKRGKNGIGDDDDPFAILEDAAKRTTTPQVIDPFTSFGPRRRSGGQQGQPSQQQTKQSAESTSRLGKKKMKKKAKVVPKTKKQIDEEEAAAFLEEATKRLTSLQPSKLSNAPGQALNKPTIARKPPKEVEKDEADAFLKEATKRVKGAGLSELAKVSNQTLYSTISAPRKPKQIEEEEADGFPEEAIKKVKNGGLSELTKAPSQTLYKPISALEKQKQIKSEEADAFLEEAIKRAKGEEFSLLSNAPRRPSENVGSSSHFIKERANRIANPNAVPRARPAGAGRGYTEDIYIASRHGVKEENQGGQLLRWYRQAMDRAKSREQGLRGSASNRDPHPPKATSSGSIYDSLAQRKYPTLIEPWKLRAARPANSMSPAERIQNKGKSQRRTFHSQSRRDGIGNINSPVNTVKHMDSNMLTDHKHAAASEEKGIDRLKGGNEAELDTGVQHSHPSVQGNTSAASQPPEKSIAGALGTMDKHTSGVLSSLEHEQLSSLLSSLRSQSAGIHQVPGPIVEQEQNTKSALDIVPLSPYQHLQAKERRVKEQATAEARRRLQDNPWAEWLASPVRMCQATGLRLPNKLLIGWNYVRNPKDDRVYMMPEELANMSHLDPGARNTSSTGNDANEGPAQETLSSGALERSSVGNAVTSKEAEQSSEPLRKANEEAEADGIGSQPISKGSTLHQSKPKPPIAPAKIYIRPSTILLQELNKRFLAVRERGVMKDDGSPVRRSKTAPSTVNRLIPHRWKDQARKFEKSADAKNPQAGFLTPEEMRKVQWHPDIQGVMLNLLRMRVMKTLEGVTVRNLRHSGIDRRIIPFPPVSSGDSSRDAVATTISGVEQAAFLWLGGHMSTYNRGSSGAVPADPSTCHHYILRFVPLETPTHSDESSGEFPSEKSDQAYIPAWTNSSSPPANDHGNLIISPAQKDYMAPSIRIELPSPLKPNHDHTANNNNAEVSSATRNLPVFDLPLLLGSSHISTLHTTQAIADAFHLKKPNTSGWVMVKGGKETRGFKEMVQEIWRLWLFVGGRRWER